MVKLQILWWLFLGTQATGSSMECLWAKTYSENQGFRVLRGQTYPNGQRFFLEHGRSWGMSAHMLFICVWQICQQARWEKPGKLWSLTLLYVAVLDAFQLRWAIRIPVKDIDFSSSHFVVPWACKLIEHLRASSWCAVVSFALPPVPFATPCVSLTPISARYVRQFL